MLKRFYIQDFTVFADADFEPEPNVTVGTNGIEKSHVLKLDHAVETVEFDLNKQLPEN